jgi:hypothetical protein
MRPSVIGRVLGGIALAAGFLFMASVFVPDFTQAGQDDGNRAPAPAQTVTTQDAPPADPHADLLLIGTIEDDAYVLRVYATDGGARYSVFDHDGRALGTLLTAEEVVQQFPELPVPAMDYGTEVPVMLAPTRAGSGRTA